MSKEVRKGEKRKMAKGEEEKLDKIDIKKMDEMSVMEQSEAAVVAAGELLEGFESIVEDDEKRVKATTTSGVVVGAGINYMLDAAMEPDGEKRSELYKKGGVTAMEVGTGIVKTLIAGERRRNSRKV
jgi:hypothetical protein